MCFGAWRQHNSMILHRIISVMPSIASLKLFKYDKSLRLIKHILRSGDFLLEVNILFAEEYEIWGFRATFIVGIRLFCIKLTVTLWEVVQTLKKKSCCIYLQLCIGWTNRKNVRYFGNHWQKNKCQFRKFNSLRITS